MGKIENSPGPVKKIMYLSAAYEYQHLYIAQQVGLCSNVPIMPIKTIAENSGMTVRKPTPSKTDRRSGPSNSTSILLTATSNTKKTARVNQRRFGGKT